VLNWELGWLMVPKGTFVEEGITAYPYISDEAKQRRYWLSLLEWKNVQIFLG